MFKGKSKKNNSAVYSQKSKVFFEIPDIIYLYLIIKKLNIRIKMDEKYIFVKGALLAWIVISFFMLSALVISFTTERSFTGKFMPQCSMKTIYNSECALCGMTTAFYEISDGNPNAAFHLNKGSLMLYPLFVINLIVCFTFLFRNTIIRISQQIQRKKCR